MNGTLTSQLHQTYGVRKFVQSILDELRQRRSLLILLPDKIDPRDVWELVRYPLTRDEFRIEELSVRPLPNPTMPGMFLTDFFGLETSQLGCPPAFELLPSLLADRCDVMHIDGLDTRSEAERAAWCRYVARWSQLSQAMADRGQPPPALCLPISAKCFPELPPTGAYLSRRCWWGLPSALDVESLCRVGNDLEPPSVAARWREYLLPSLAGNDVHFAELLWDKLHLPFEQIQHSMRTYAETWGWTAENLRAWGADEFLRTSGRLDGQYGSEPPAAWRDLWISGALANSPEYGIELHTAALVLLGCVDQARHRLWRGQAALLLPLIDGLRLAVCQHLTWVYQANWPIRWVRPDSQAEDLAVSENPLACQLGHLKAVLSHSELRREDNWLRLVTVSHRVRNELAHYRPVLLSELQALVAEAHRLGLVRQLVE